MKEKIIELRAYKDYTQEDLAIKMQVSLSTIKSWESGRRIPQAEHIRKILQLRRKAGLDEL